MEQTCLEVLGEKLEDKLKDLHLHQGFACGPNYYIQAGKKGPTGHGLVCR